MDSTCPPLPPARRRRLAAIAGATIICAAVAGAASAAPTSFHIITNVGGSNAYLFDGNNAHQRTYATVAQPGFAAVSPDGSYAAISSLGGKASIINLTTHVVTDFDYSSGGSSMGKPVFSTDGRYVFLPQRIITGSSPYKLKVHRVDLTGATPASQTAEIAAITNCGSPAAVMQVSGGTDRLWVSCYTNNTLTPLSNLDGGTFSPSAGTSWTLGASNSQDIAISADQTTAYLAQLAGLIKVPLASGTETTLATPFGGCSAVLVNAANTYVYGSCGTSNGGQGIYRVPTSGGSVASNLGGAPDNARQIAFGPSEVQIWQPDLGFNQSGGTSVMTWTTSALGGGASAQAQTSTPAFNGPSGIAFGVRASAPDAPTSVSATPGNAQATVNWTAPAGNGGAALTAYTVTASPGGATCTATPPQTSCTVTGLTNGAAYTFSVVATNSVGASAASTSSPAVTPTAPSPEPTTPSGQQSASQSSSGTNGGSPVPAAPTVAVRGATPSNQVSSVTITSRVSVNGAGSIRQVGRHVAAGSGNALCSAARKAPRAGTFRTTCVLDATARRELTRRPMRVRLTTTFTAASGTSVRASQIVVLRRIHVPRPAVTG